jgi:hypothetical protein
VTWVATKGTVLLSSGVANPLKAVLLSGDLREWAFLFIFIEVPHRNHTYDVPILIQHDQIWQMAFAHDFSDLIHSLSLEAVSLPYLHYTVNILVLAEIRGGDCLCRSRVKPPILRLAL